MPTQYVNPASHSIDPEWNGKLDDLNEWSTNQGGTTFKKSNDNTLTAKLDKNLTVNFFTASRSFTITKGQATRNHMIKQTDNMREWLKSTHDSDHNLDDELQEILSHEANWKIPSQTISQSPSTTHSEEVEEEGKKSARKDTPKANETEEYDSILDTNYMRDIDKHLSNEDNFPVYSIRKEHVPIMWNTIVKTVLKHNTFKHFDNWLVEYMKGLSNQKATAIKWFMDNAPKMLTLILNKNCAQLATETERDTTLLGNSTDKGMPPLDTGTDMTKPQPKDQTIKRQLSRSLTGPTMAYMDGEQGSEGQMADILTRLKKLEEQNGTLKIQLDITSAQAANLHNTKFNPTNIPDVTSVETRLGTLEKAMIPFTDEDKAKTAIDAKRHIPKIVFSSEHIRDIKEIKGKQQKIFERISQIQPELDALKHVNDSDYFQNNISEFFAMNPGVLQAANKQPARATTRPRADEPTQHEPDEYKPRETKKQSKSNTVSWADDHSQEEDEQEADTIT